jgi:hypothetical protein
MQHSSHKKRLPAALSSRQKPHIGHQHTQERNRGQQVGTHPARDHVLHQPVRKGRQQEPVEKGVVRTYVLVRVDFGFRVGGEIAHIRLRFGYFIFGWRIFEFIFRVFLNLFWGFLIYLNF